MTKPAWIVFWILLALDVVLGVVLYFHSIQAADGWIFVGLLLNISATVAALLTAVTDASGGSNDGHAANDFMNTANYIHIKQIRDRL